MKFNQLLFLIIIVNLLNVTVLFATQSTDINDFETRFNDWFNDDNKGFFQKVEDFSKKTTSVDDWKKTLPSDVTNAFTTVVNVVTIGFQIAGLVFWGQFAPIEILVTGNTGSPFLNMLGIIAIIYLWSFNIRAIISLYTLIKGSDS
jgi:hypothetical protein